MSRKGLLVLAAAAVLLIPVTSQAAPGTFDSATFGADGSAVKATNTYLDGGFAYGVYASAAGTDGIGVYGAAFATSGTTYGVYGYAQSASSTGVYGFAAAGSGFTTGVFGVSVSTTGRGLYGWARATSGGTYGVIGYANESPSGTGVFGSGGKYGVYSATDLAAARHVVAKGGNVAGTCTVAAGATSKTCVFPAAFAAGTTPIVVVVPKSDPVTRYWISGATTTGFTLRVSASRPVSRGFNYIVVGVLSTLAPPSSPGSR